jgi:glycosyltransferase involved in cell wall biosynthesis
VRVLLTIHHALDANTGAAGATVQLAHALGELGHDARVFTWDDVPDRLGPRGKEASFPAWASTRIRRGVKEHVDIVDASTCDAWPWLLLRRTLGADRRGPAIITRTHGLEHTYRAAREAAALATGERIGPLERIYHGFWRLRETEVTLRLADATCFLNRADRDRAVRDLRVPSERAHLVANGIPDAFAGLPSPSPRPGGAPLRIVQIGSWDPRKGVGATLRAMRALIDEQLDVELRLLGTGAADPGAIRDAFGPAARERVTVQPAFRREELPTLLGDADVLLHPSLAEGSSVALLEGMACGLAPVASRVGGAPDVIASERSGLLVEPGDASAVKESLARLHRDRELLQRLRIGAQDAVQRYRWSCVAADTAALYAQVAARRRG